MASLLRTVAGALLLAAPLLGHAQTPAPDASAPRYYVGLAAYHSNYQNLSSWRYGDTGFRVPVQLTAGYQLRPRLALELGVAYSGRTSTYSSAGYYYDAAGNGYDNQYFQTTTTRITSVSALARYTLMPAHRFQVDALGGLTLLHGRFHSRGYNTNNVFGTPETIPFDEHPTRTDLLLTAGVGLRYRLTPRLGLNFDITTNYNLTTPTIYNDGFTGSVALGVRYRFGQ